MDRVFSEAILVLRMSIHHGIKVIMVRGIIVKILCRDAEKTVVRHAIRHHNSAISGDNFLMRHGFNRLIGDMDHRIVSRLLGRHRSTKLIFRRNYADNETTVRYVNHIKVAVSLMVNFRDGRVNVVNPI